MIAFDRIAKQLREAGRSRRGPGYRWLIQHYDALQETIAADGPQWKALAAIVASLGIRGVKGQVISAECLRQSWQIVCKDKAHLTARLATASQAAPQRPPPLPPGWAPHPVQSQPSSQRSPSVNTTPSPPAQLPARSGEGAIMPWDDPSLPEEVRTRLLELKAQFDHHDRHILVR